MLRAIGATVFVYFWLTVIKAAIIQAGYNYLALNVFHLPTLGIWQACLVVFLFEVLNFGTIITRREER